MRKERKQEWRECIMELWRASRYSVNNSYFVRERLEEMEEFLKKGNERGCRLWLKDLYGDASWESPKLAAVLESCSDKLYGKMPSELKE